MSIREELQSVAGNLCDRDRDAAMSIANSLRPLSINQVQYARMLIRRGQKPAPSVEKRESILAANRDAAELLHQTINSPGYLSDRGLDIARDLYRKAGRFVFTPKQIELVQKLAHDAKHHRRVTDAPAHLEANLKPLSVAIMLASSNLKKPVLRVRAGESTYRIKLAKNKGPGVIYIVDSRNQFIGTADAEGRFWPRVKGQDLERATRELNEIAQDPLQAARLYAKSTGECAYCGRELEDERSVSAGYGPICAKNWGLPWGEHK